MLMAFDLQPRQAARVLEQALRARPDFTVEMRNMPDDEPLLGKLVAREGNLLVVELREYAIDAPLTTLIGAFCDIRTVLSGELYLMTCCVLDVGENPAPGQLLLSVPEHIQVANRRQCERTNATVASQVRVWAPGQSSASVGLLHNVSNDGLACDMPGLALDAALALGDRVRVSFELAGFEGNFEMNSVVFNKALDAAHQQLRLGLQFDTDEKDATAVEALKRLRAALQTLTNNLSSRDENQ